MGRRRSDTKDEWTDAGKGLLRAADELKKKPHVEVGFPEKVFERSKKGTTGEVTLGMVAVANEFGTDTIPERSFIRSTFDTKKGEWIAATDQMKMDVILRRRSSKQALGILGEMIKRDDQDAIRAGGLPYVPNAPSTIAAKTRDGKKGDHPLVNTAQMLNSVTYVVVNAD